MRLTGDGTAANPGSAVFQRFAPGAPEDSDGRPAFLVATSAGEVGVDLDADDMVCDLVPWERMVQRLGRVNRRAEPGVAQIAVIPVAKEKEAEEAIDDTRLATLRAPFTSSAWPVGADGARDASPAALMALKDRIGKLIEDATTPEPLRPPLTRAVVDAWSLTSIEEHPGRPNVEPWIRGWVTAEPQTAVVWRARLPLREGEERVTPDLRAFFEAAPPHVSERFEAPSWRVGDVLIKRAKALTKGSAADEDIDDGEAGPSDGEGEPAAADEAVAAVTPPAPKHRPVVVALTADDTVERVWTDRQIGSADFSKDRFIEAIAGRTLVVDRRLGGLDEDGLLDEKEPKGQRRIPTLDSDDDVVWGIPPETGAGFRVRFGARPDSKRDGWRLAEFRWSESDADDAPGLWVELWRGRGTNPGRASIAVQLQRLDEHHTATQHEMERIADGLGVPSPWREMLIAAAGCHDLGKNRKRWLDAMGAPRGDRPYAKTAGGGNGRALDGYRHEFGSLVDVLRNPGRHLPSAVAADPKLFDLMLHLIAAHHGWARPTIKPDDPGDRYESGVLLPGGGTTPSLAAPLAQEAALSFARLQAAWGPWRLAWWETLLRAADWSASRALNETREPEAPAPAAPAALETADG